MYREYGQVVAVTNRSLTERPFLEQIRRVCEMHPDALILREKDLSEKEYEELAQEVMNVCAEYQVPCILHTFWQVAEKLKCDTVHLPLPILRQFVLEKQNQKNKTEEKTIREKELLEAKRKAEQKALQERIQEKETKLAGKEEKELLEHIKGWETQKEQRKAAQKTAKEELDAVQKNLTEVQAALAAIQMLEAADEEADLQGQQLPSETELQENLEMLSGRKQELDQRYNEQYHAANTNQNVYQAVQTQQSQMQEVEEEYKWVNALADTATGNVTGKRKIDLETYAQMAYFDRILRKANVRFLTMSQGQYELKRQEDGGNIKSKAGLELNVIDHYNGTERSVRTLSGGESFQASLSLALGLSDEIQSYAGGIQLDSMFVDEGFGSLDAESLNQAVKALEGLAEGNCLVGIISHVPELKDRIERKIVVTKNRSRDGVGSRAVIE